MVSVGCEDTQRANEEKLQLPQEKHKCFVTEKKIKQCAIGVFNLITRKTPWGDTRGGKKLTGTRVMGFRV